MIVLAILYSWISVISSKSMRDGHNCHFDELKEKVNQLTFRYDIEEEMEALTMKEKNHH